jgi:hypothetical protein
MNKTFFKKVWSAIEAGSIVVVNKRLWAHEIACFNLYNTNKKNPHKFMIEAIDGFPHHITTFRLSSKDEITFFVEEKCEGLWEDENFATFQRVCPDGTYEQYIFVSWLASDYGHDIGECNIFVDGKLVK